MSTNWPELSYREGRATYATLRLWTQIVGKIRLVQTPWLNHSWHVPLYVTARGLTTSPISHGSRFFELQFDFNKHVLDIEVSDGTSRQIVLEPRSVADFYGALMRALSELRISVAIDELPCEIEGAIPFSQDLALAAYDADCAQNFWHALLLADRMLKRFRTGFLGKSSPVHFFWGSFDLAVTRFSGRRAPPFSGRTPGVATAVMREAYSHEVSSAGFWPGGDGADYPAFYSYAYPMPKGFAVARVIPEGAAFNEALGQFLLPYETMRRLPDADAALLGFLQSTFEAAARAAEWDPALECDIGVPGVPRDAPA
jgi:hypothetical protein